MKLRYFFYELFLLIPLSSGQTSCVTQSDCNNSPSIYCGICYNETPDVRKCIFPFDKVFKPGKDCSKISACDGNCDGHGECVTTSIGDSEVLPTCKCQEDFYGRTCQHSASKEWSGIFFRSIEFPFKSVKKTADSYTETMKLYCSLKKRMVDGYLEVTSGDEGYSGREFIDTNLCETQEWKTYSYETKYRYVPLNDVNNKVVNLGNDVLGYVSWCKVTVVMSGVINYQHQFPVFVSYFESYLECIPVVKLLGCGTSKSNEVTTTREHPVRIESHVSFIADGKYISTSKTKPECVDHVREYKWSVWSNRNKTNNDAKVMYNSKELIYKPFQSEIGNVQILLEVITQQNKYTSNYAFCYFNVMFVPLVAIIDGGSERVVQKHLGVALRTTRSKDPNMPSNEQGHVKASWSCVDTSDNNREICDPSKLLPVSNSHHVPPEKLNFGAVITITLKVWTDYYKNCEACGNVQPAIAYATIIVAKMNEAKNHDISIQCLLNCNKKVVSSEKLYLKVKKRNESMKGEFEWTYLEQGNTKEIDTNNISVQGLPNLFLLVKESAFSNGKNYTIVVKTKQDGLMAKYSIETVDVKIEGNCSLHPTTGTRGLSTFNIFCQNFTANGKASSFLFEFYDKSLEEAQGGYVFTGRMMGTSHGGALRDFRVTRGQIYVYVKDDSGLFTYKQFIVNLTDWNLNEKLIEDIFTNITKLKKERDYTKIIEYMSIIPDVVPSEMNKSKILESLLHLVVNFQMTSLSDVKVTLSALSNSILKLNKPTGLTVEPNLMNTIVGTILNQVKLFSSTVSTGTELKGTSSKEITYLASTFINCLYAVLTCKDPRTLRVNEFDSEFQNEDTLMQISNTASEVIHLIQNVLTFLQSPGLPPINVTSEDKAYIVWALKNDRDYDLTNYLTKSSGLPVNLLKYFLKEFDNPVSKRLEELALRIAKLDNIFWWRISDVKSNLTSVSLVKQLPNKKLKKIAIASRTLGVEINLIPSLIKPIEISGITFKYQYNKKCSLDLDQAIKIHRFDPAPKSLMTLRFIFPPTNGSLQVLIYRNHRPECDMMKRAVNISEQSPNYPPVLIDQDEPTFYYIGIIPGPSYINDSVRYTFQVNTTVCQHWVRGFWSDQGCKISHLKTKDLEVHCNCDHFSIFAAAFPVPPQEIDPFSEISLFLTVFDNPIIVIFVSAVLLIYFTACLWAFCKDRNDRLLRNVIVLDDNYPEDRFPYLLAVYTSSRFNAGTTAHVGIKIIGSLAMSRAHILASPERKTLKRNFDDWFLIYYAEPLGELNHIHIWHDNAGSSPDWFCDKIVVYDLKENSDATFVVEEWLALRPDCYPEATISAATISDVKNMKRLFVDNCVLGVRENHMLLSIFFRHPRSAMSRLQKVSVLMCCVMIAMLCSIIFYSPKVDGDSYSVTVREFYISVQSLLICSVVTFLVLFAFKRSYTYTYQRHRSVTLYKQSHFQECDPLQNIQNRGTFYASYVRFVSKRLRGNPLVPVHMAKFKSVVNKRRVYIFISWASCVTLIFTCAFFVILYGLKLGSVKIKKWISSVLFTVSGELLIMGPVKIIIMSTLLSVAFQLTSETSTHHVYVEDALQVKPPAEMERYVNISEKRKGSMYIPLRHSAIDRMIRKKEVKERLLTVIDFVASLCFVTVLSFVLYELWASNYNTNRHVNNVANKPHRLRTGFELFSSATNVMEIENYLQQVLIHSLYERYWYNGDPIIEKGVERGYWQSDYTLRNVGLQRLRQLRVVPVACVSRFVNTTSRCIPRWDTSHEDTQAYSVRWGVAQWNDLQEDNSLWRYTKSSLAMVYTMYRLYGGSGTLYHDGGYLTHLGPESSTAEITIAETITNNWQDQLTRALFVEFSLYNVNTNLLSQVTIIVEYLITGNVQLRIEVVSVKSKINLSFWNVLLAVFLIYYVVQSSNAINRQGLMQFLECCRNWTQVSIIFVGVLGFIVAFVHYFYSAAKYDEFIKSGQSIFFDFDSYVFYFLLLKKFLPLLFCLAVFRSVILLRAGRHLANLYHTLTLTVSEVIFLTVLILLFLLLQIYYMLLLMYSYCFHSVLDVLMASKFCNQCTEHRTEVLLFFKLLFGSLMLKLYFVIFTYSLRIARTVRLKKSEKLNFIAIIFDPILNKIKK